jgi:hypothetical protein
MSLLTPGLGSQEATSSAKYSTLLHEGLQEVPVSPVRSWGLTDQARISNPIPIMAEEAGPSGAGRQHLDAEALEALETKFQQGVESIQVCTVS